MYGIVKAMLTLSRIALRTMQRPCRIGLLVTYEVFNVARCQHVQHCNEGGGLAVRDPHFEAALVYRNLFQKAS